MGVEHKVQITYSEQTVNDAVWLYWKRKVGIRDTIIDVLFLIFILYLYFVLGYQTWFYSLVLSVLVLYIVVAIMVYVVSRARMMAVLRSMGTPTANWTFTNDFVIGESGAGKTELKWTVFKGIWKSDSMWLLMYVNGTFSSLPIQTIPQEVRDFIERKVKEAGGNIR